ncbi:MAG: hypothetical protein MUC87_14540 [Bacteroidia bacterium]|jgi:hypothetical protein|nr:hypothetical protein [Bacteroidia bacterium]
MKKAAVTFLFSMILCSLFAQSTYRTNRGDSVWFQGKLYSQADYKLAKEAYEKLNFTTYFMPGLGYKYYQPKASDSTGSFSGLTVEYLIYAKVEQSDDPGPSHVRFYSKLNILRSDKSNINSMFMYTLGLDLSLEKNPKRTFLIPYFGLEFGGISQKQFGSTVQFTPTFGIHVLSKKNLFINLQGGYMYPISNFEMLQGWMGQAGVNFALW